MLLGKAVRQERIFDRNTRRTIIVPMDHGVSVGPIYGLVDFKGTVNYAADGGANAVLMHKGLPRCTHRGYGRDIGLILHLSASTHLSPHPEAKALVATVEDALKIGADGVSVHVNLGDESEREMLADLGRVTARAMEWGVPVLATIRATGEKAAKTPLPALISHCARVGVELGADLVNVSYTGDIESFARVVEASCVPVIISGGPKADNALEFLAMVHDACLAGGAGVCVGRNVFQHPDPAKVVSALEGIVHRDWDMNRIEDFLVA